MEKAKRSPSNIARACVLGGPLDNTTLITQAHLAGDQTTTQIMFRYHKIDQFTNLITTRTNAQGRREYVPDDLINGALL